MPWADDYFGEFARMAQDPEAMRFISGGKPLTFQGELAFRTGHVAWYAIDRPG